MWFNDKIRLHTTEFRTTFTAKYVRLLRFFDFLTAFYLRLSIVYSNFNDNEDEQLQELSVSILIY